MNEDDMTQALNAAIEAAFVDLDRHTADMEGLIAAGEVTDPVLILFTQRVRAVLEERR